MKPLHHYSEKGIRQLVKKIKDPFDTKTRSIIAEEMAQYIPSKAILIPALSSDGINQTIFLLAEEIASKVDGAIVIEAIIRKKPVESSYKRRLAGKAPVTIKEHVDSMDLTINSLPLNRPVIIIDNVRTSGNTIAAMKTLLKPEIEELVYADAKRIKKRNPIENLVVTISGSRNYKNLWKIVSVLQTLPKGTMILHGGANGVDKYVDKIARLMGFNVMIFPAEWEKYYKGAGMIRNKIMLEQSDYLIAFWDGISRGTKGIIEIAKKMDMDYDIYDDEGFI